MRVVKVLGLLGLHYRPKERASRAERKRDVRRGNRTYRFSLLVSCLENRIDRYLQLYQNLREREVAGGFRMEWTHVYLRPIQVDAWQKPSQYCKVIILLLKLIKKRILGRNQQKIHKTLSNFLKGSFITSRKIKCMRSKQNLSTLSSSEVLINDIYKVIIM